MKRSSGSTLPLVLRRKYKMALEGKNEEANEASKKGIVEPFPLTSPTKEQSNRVFTADELEETLFKASVSMIEIQKQLSRGEELYHEETNAHGNLFRGGWEAFIDLKDVGLSAAGSAGAPTVGGSRRMPNDNRWFSGSCRSFQRNSRPGAGFLRASIPTTPTPTSRRSTPVVGPTSSASRPPSVTPSAAPVLPIPKPNPALKSTATVMVGGGVTGGDEPGTAQKPEPASKSPPTRMLKTVSTKAASSPPLMGTIPKKSAMKAPNQSSISQLSKPIKRKEAVTAPTKGPLPVAKSSTPTPPIIPKPLAAPIPKVESFAKSPPAAGLPAPGPASSPKPPSKSSAPASKQTAAKTPKSETKQSTKAQMKSRAEGGVLVQATSPTGKGPTETPTRRTSRKRKGAD